MVRFASMVQLPKVEDIFEQSLTRPELPDV